MVPLLFYPILLFSVVNGMDRNDLTSIIVSTIALSVTFAFLKTKVSLFRNHFPSFFLYHLLLRCVVLGVTPALSDDIYRYLFDAKLLFYGENPYQLTPNQWLLEHPNLWEQTRVFVTEMNSSDYISVYPIFLLFIFVLGTFLNDLLYTSFLGIQLLFLTFDLLNLILIRRFYPKESFSFYWIYFGNPLVIIEGISQLHPEILFLPWLLLLIQLQKNRILGFVFLILTQIKLNTTIFLLAFLQKSKSFFVLLGFGFVSLVIWKWTVFANWESQGNRGIGLFFHSFRFAGILEPFFYFPFHKLGISYLSGIFSLVCFGLVNLSIFLQPKFQKANMEKKLLFVYFSFLLFSPVIHSWYWIPFIVLGMCSRIPFKWQIFVVSLGFLSYIIYVSEIYFYFYWVYSFIGFCIYVRMEIDYFCKTT